MTSPEAPHEQPYTGSSAFACPHCGVYAHHLWTNLKAEHTQLALYVDRPNSMEEGFGIRMWRMSVCMRCQRNTIFYGNTLIYPHAKLGPNPAADMPDGVRSIYEEARAVASASPRAAAALLRVAVETLVNELEPGKGDLNAKIGRMVARGLDPAIQKMLDTVRVIGNEGGAHPGEINMGEQPEVVGTLTFCVNTIVDRMITYPRRIDEAYSLLSPRKLEGIENRDRKASDSGNGETDSSQS